MRNFFLTSLKIFQVLLLLTTQSWNAQTEANGPNSFVRHIFGQRLTTVVVLLKNFG